MHNTSDGIELVMLDSVNALETARRLNCHLAYARVNGFDKPSCPLFTGGLTIAMKGLHGISSPGETPETAARIQEQAARIFGGAASNTSGDELMATKAERFRYDSQRGKRHESPRKKHTKRRDTPDQSGRATSRAAPKRRRSSMTEESQGRRSRKSSRTSSNRGQEQHRAGIRRCVSGRSLPDEARTTIMKTPLRATAQLRATAGDRLRWRRGSLLLGRLLVRACIKELHPVPPRACAACRPSWAWRTRSEKPYSRPGSPAATPTEMVGERTSSPCCSVARAHPLADAPRDDERARQIGVRHQQQHAVSALLHRVVGVAQRAANREREAAHQLLLQLRRRA